MVTESGVFCSHPKHTKVDSKAGNELVKQVNCLHDIDQKKVVKAVIVEANSIV